MPSACRFAIPWPANQIRAWSRSNRFDRPLRIGLVGFGAIAQGQHLPVINSDDRLCLVAVASLDGGPKELPGYRRLEDMLDAHPELGAIVMCQPPAARFKAASAALRAEKHVFLEKPPGTTPHEVEQLQAIARENNVALFAGWHSRWANQVGRLRDWCRQHQVERVGIDWKEDVLLWHPGQKWIWEQGGFGVLDPGINALSILTEVLPGDKRLVSASFERPANKATPIASRMELLSASGAIIEAVFDWRQTGPQIWRMEFSAGSETFVFQQGSGGEDSFGGDVLSAEYAAMYDHFVELVNAREQDVDCRPLQIIADAYECGETVVVEPFEG